MGLLALPENMRIFLPILNDAARPMGMEAYADLDTMPEGMDFAGKCVCVVPSTGNVVPILGQNPFHSYFYGLLFCEEDAGVCKPRHLFVSNQILNSPSALLWAISPRFF